MSNEEVKINQENEETKEPETNNQISVEQPEQPAEPTQIAEVSESTEKADDSPESKPEPEKVETNEKTEQSADAAPESPIAETQPEAEPIAETPAEPAKEEVKTEATATAETSVTETASTEIAAPAPADEKSAEEKAKAEEERKAKAIEKAKAEEEKKAKAEERQKHFAEIFDSLKKVKEEDGTIKVTVRSRIRGGLRVVYDDMPLFLPASHFSLKRNPTEDEMKDSEGKEIEVHIHELQEEESGRKTVIVSRKRMLDKQFWNTINVGDIVEGKISSIASFGVFVDMGGVEGLIHISRLSQVHVRDPKDLFKKGDTIKCVIVSADREKNRIALSRKELEESPWKGIDAEFPEGSTHKGIVRRITDFGAYVEMKPGIDGLLRTAELSWTKRIKDPADVLKVDEEIDVYVMAVNEEKQTMTLSFKKTTENPWEELKEKYPINSEFKGTVMQVMPQGALVTIEGDIDGFMPRSKIRPMMQGKKIPLSVGDELEVVIADLIPADESLILAPKVDEEALAAANAQNNERRQDRRPRRDSRPANMPTPDDNSFTLLDLLSEEAKDNLLDQMK